MKILKKILKKILPRYIVDKIIKFKKRNLLKKPVNTEQTEFNQEYFSNIINELNNLQPIKVYEEFLKKGYYVVKYPEVLSIFLTTKCNLNCFICRREEYRGEDLKIENLYKLKNAIKFAKIVDLTGWGEPLIYPKFEKVLEYICSLNKGKVIQFTTNGTKLSKRIAELLKGNIHGITISLNAATEKTYNRDMIPAKFENTMKSIVSFLSNINEEDLLKISLHFVAHTENYNELSDFVSLAHDLGIKNVSFGNYLVGNEEHVKYSLFNIKNEWNDAVEQAYKLGNKKGINVYARKFYSEKERPRIQCDSPFREVFININGEVRPCCYSGNYCLGNAYETSFEDVWFGANYFNLRERRHLSACSTCTPFMPFDSFCTHFTGKFRVSEKFKEVERLFNFNNK